LKKVFPKSTNDFDAIRISVASPEQIKSWSYGEVTEPETINYRTLKPERDGLFCERIFGPVKDYECSCGKYKKKKNRGIICDRCGVEVTESKVRRKRMGHIDLVTPVAHIWFFKNLPNRLGLLLGLKSKNVKSIIYYDKYFVTDPGDVPELVEFETDPETGKMNPIMKKRILTEKEYEELIERYGEESFEAEMGAPALKKVLEKYDLEHEFLVEKQKLQETGSKQKKKKILKRMRLIKQLKDANIKPSWMILEVVPVIPADLRPLVPLEGGKFATSDLNDLYRRVIHRNNRLKKLMTLNAPEIILKNERRMLQESVDALFDNSRRKRPVTGTQNRPLKSLSDMLKGKQGRFRQNLLGKRVDYSGRSVIVVDPKLKLHQCGIPKKMALELFKPFLLNKIEENMVDTLKGARKILEQASPEVWKYLDEIIEDHPVLLNRAPTLHKLSIQAFMPHLIEEKAIKIHPLVCPGYNADFDGDQMGVHLPLSKEAQIEARTLMLSKYNILKPAHGEPVATPTQDMVLGLYYITKEKKDQKGEGKIFNSMKEVMIAFENRSLSIHAKIKVKGINKIKESDKWKLEDIKNVDKWKDYTTTGRVIFNYKVLPEGFRYINEILDKKTINNVSSELVKNVNNNTLAETLDNMKEVGFKYSTLSGTTFSMDDLVTPDIKSELIEKTQKKVDKYWDNYRNGYITETERYNMIIEEWTHADEELTDEMIEKMANDKKGFNPIYMMMDSGARGSRTQISQLAGMRGLMQKPQKKLTGGVGEIIENPILASFREGLSVLQYFISSHGARKGLADTALKTADAGYLTRKLVDVSQEIVIREDDCGTVRGIEIGALKDGEEVIIPISERIKGRISLHDIEDPEEPSKYIVKSGEIISVSDAKKIEEVGIETVYVRSVLTCESKKGVCARCYGHDLTSKKDVEVGQAVGILAAQSIGEPGTQLTLRTFHVGGSASRVAEESEVSAKVTGHVKLKDISTVKDKNGNIVVTNRSGKLFLYDKNNNKRSQYEVPYAAKLEVKDGDKVKKGDVLFEWDPFIRPIIAEKDGKVDFKHIIEGKTLDEVMDSSTATIQRVIVEDKSKKLHPRVIIESEEKKSRKKKSKKKKNDKEDTKKRSLYYLPVGAYLIVDEGDEIKAGDLIAKTPRQVGKTKDITGGLPRITELFEARKPKRNVKAFITEIDGRVEYGKISRGKRIITVKNEFGDKKKYKIPLRKQILVNPGDTVKSGDRLTSGNINPHDILKVKGLTAVQKYLLNEIQEVYRIQGVEINDKHIELVIRQMTRKVSIKDPGDSYFMPKELINRNSYMQANEKLISEGKEPATAKPVLLGITKASLNTDSFLSDASFQETTRVLTDSALEGKIDYLEGLKENIIIGHLIPAGTYAKQNRNIDVLIKDDEIEKIEMDLDE